MRSARRRWPHHILGGRTGRFAICTATIGAACAGAAGGAPVINNDPANPTIAQRGDLPRAMRLADARKFRAMITGRRTHAVAPWQGFLTATQEPQWNVFYCGPAAVSASLRQVAANHPGTWVVNQAQAARSLGTTRDGTVWSDGIGSPVARTMNRHTPTGVHYVAHFVAGASPAEVAKLSRVVRFDIALDRHPVIGDAFEAPNSRYHLTGHPTNRIIFHWFNIRGYSEGGRRIHYQDSVANASSVTWHAAVPRYSSRSAVAMASILAGRGYVW